MTREKDSAVREIAMSVPPYDVAEALLEAGAALAAATGTNARSDEGVLEAARIVGRITERAGVPSPLSDLTNARYWQGILTDRRLSEVIRTAYDAGRSGLVVEVWRTSPDMSYRATIYDSDSMEVLGRTMFPGLTFPEVSSLVCWAAVMEGFDYRMTPDGSAGWVPPIKPHHVTRAGNFNLELTVAEEGE